MSVPVTCMFCGEAANLLSPGSVILSYTCERCGEYKLTLEAAEDFPGEEISQEGKQIISIVLRNAYERGGRKPPKEPLKLEHLLNAIQEYRQKDPLEKMDIALLNIDKKTSHVGHKVTVPTMIDYPLFHCMKYEELDSVLALLYDEGIIRVLDRKNAHEDISITAKGYSRLRDLKKLQADSSQVFIAMWFADEMQKFYEETLCPAIEYEEDGATPTGLKAIKIDMVEHVNNINDEIIAQIRRSRFMVCDLTGYRGGVYFEAGFAYGLGMKVFYTCRKDWCKSDTLFNSNDEATRQPVNVLYDINGNEVKIQKEGVHFDIDHMNRLEWESDSEKLKDFQKKLRNRIKANIF